MQPSEYVKKVKRKCFKHMKKTFEPFFGAGNIILWQLCAPCRCALGLVRRRVSPGNLRKKKKPLILEQTGHPSKSSQVV